MKKLLFTSILALGLLLPTTFSASTSSTTSTSESFSKKPKKNSKSRKSSRSNRAKGYSSSKSKRSYIKSNRDCTYNGHQLYVGSRGGCYYYTGNSKQYVDRAYCSGCN